MTVDVAILDCGRTEIRGSMLAAPVQQALVAVACAVQELEVERLCLGAGAAGAVPEWWPRLADGAPRARFSPRTGRLHLRYATRHGPEPDRVGAQLAELAAVVQALAARRRNADLLVVADSIRALSERVPARPDEVRTFLADASRAVAEREADRPWWERLGVRWEAWHPAARTLLDAPLFWEEEGEGPHANDTGADLLRAYRRAERGRTPAEFFERLLARWEVPLAWRSRPPAQWVGDDETGVATWGAAAIALAFAELKLAGTCSAEARALALEAIERETDREVAARFGWTLRPARAAALRRMRSVLVHG
jgi:hypothetical protein